ncbi:MAG: DUF899 family protein [Thiotrichales bacterium]|nr:DUF899 family protein [Thiotrichales bacterium]
MFPNESSEYRNAREKLLREEQSLRIHIEKVASLRRELPLGGQLAEDYVFATACNHYQDEQIRFSELFSPDKNNLVIYNFMFAPAQELPCPSCNSMLDGLDGIAPHAMQRINLAVVAKAPPDKIRDWANRRHWENLHLLSSHDNSYNRDYLGETEAGNQMPVFNVFTRTNDGIFHTYNTELLFAATEPGQEPRHADLLWPLWALFDLTPGGRGQDWHPGHNY